MRYQDALDTALRAAQDAGADDVEVSYVGGELYFARFASSRFTQVGTVASDRVRVRALVGRKLGAQMCATLDRDAVAAAARGAVAAARTAPELEVALRFGVAGDDSDREPVWPELHESLTPAAAPSTLMKAFDVARARRCQCAGSLKIARTLHAVRTSAGVRRDGATGSADLQVIAADGDSSGFCGHRGQPDAAVDVEAVVATAADKAARGRDAARIDAGAIDVVLAPEAVAELLEWMSMASFGAQAALDGHSLLAGRTGELVCDARITVADRPGAGELRFDAEGAPRQPVTLIDAGRAGRPLTDRITALRLGDDRGSTGHASAVDADHSSGPCAAHLHMSPGDQSEQELIASVDRGLYVTRLHYVNGLLDTRRAVTTGMTRDGTFAIEGGELRGGVRNLRFTDSVLDAWGPRLGGIGRDVRDVPTWWSPGGTISVPAVLVRGFRFTGQSR